LLYIGTPTYNRPKYIRRLAVNIKNIEAGIWIIRDNGENGPLFDDLCKAGYNEYNLKYYKNEKNIGSRNNLLRILKDFVKLAKNGDSLLCVSDDDLIDEKIYKIAKLETKKNQLKVFGSVRNKNNGEDLNIENNLNIEVREDLKPDSIKNLPKFIDNLRLYSGLIIDYRLAKKILTLESLSGLVSKSWYPMQLYAFEAEEIESNQNVPLIIHTVGNEIFWNEKDVNLSYELTNERKETYKELKKIYKMNKDLKRYRLALDVSKRYNLRHLFLRIALYKIFPFKKTLKKLIYKFWS